MKILRQTLVAAVLGLLSIPAESSAKDQEYKKLTFDEFFVGQVASIPLLIEIPAEYGHAEGLEIPLTYSYWMQADEVARAAKSQDLPEKTGYIYGKLSENEAYDRTMKKFMSEDQIDAQIAQAGMELIERKRFEAKGYPVFSYIVRAKNGTVVCSMFVGTLIETNVLYLGYRPPMNNLKLGRQIWNHVLDSLK